MNMRLIFACVVSACLVVAAVWARSVQADTPTAPGVGASAPNGADFGALLRAVGLADLARDAGGARSLPRSAQAANCCQCISGRPENAPVLCFPDVTDADSCTAKCQSQQSSLIGGVMIGSCSDMVHCQ